METVLFSGMIAGLLQVFKKATGINSKFMPLVNLIISLVIAVLYTWLNHYIFTWELLVQAITVSLIASGLYNTTKTAIGK